MFVCVSVPEVKYLSGALEETEVEKQLHLDIFSFLLYTNIHSHTFTFPAPLLVYNYILFSGEETWVNIIFMKNETRQKIHY